MQIPRSRSLLSWYGLGMACWLALSLACSIGTPAAPTVDVEGTRIALDATAISLSVQATELAQPPPQPSATPEPNPTESPPIAAEAPLGLTVINQTGQPLCNLTLQHFPSILYDPAELFISLERVETLADEAQMTFTAIEPEVYRLVAAVCTGGLGATRVIQVKESTTVYLEPRHIKPLEELDQLNVLSITNESATGLCHLYIWSPHNPKRAIDVLTIYPEGLPPGQAVEIGLDEWAYSLVFQNCAGENITVDVLDFMHLDLIQWSYIEPAKMSCGNSRCEIGEDANWCPSDCSICGDGFCSTSENQDNCAQDCTGP